jgi:8-oxo-dGTP pyrophosphatase MutT (NUDIX family)
MTRIRAGIIPVVSISGVNYYGLGTDSQYLTLIDFAGGIEEKDRHLFDNAAREFTEETLGVFGTIRGEDLYHMPFIHNQECTLFFVPWQYDCKIVDNFNYKVSQEPRPEIIGINWLTLDELLSLSNKQMYWKPHNLIQENINQIQHIDQIYREMFSRQN